MRFGVWGAAALCVASGVGCGDEAEPRPGVATAQEADDGEGNVTELSPNDVATTEPGDTTATQVSDDVLPAPSMSTETEDPAPAPRGSSPLGGPCNSDSDCAVDFACVTVLGNSQEAVHLVAGGYCSVPCAADGDCAGFGEGSVCHRGLIGLDFGFCTAPCTGGSSEADTCGGRTDVMCIAAPGAAGSCFPSCGTNAECNLGECDLSNGLCAIRAPDPTESPVGSVCLADEPVTCSGFCIAQPGQDGLCSGICRLGSPCGTPDNVCVAQDPSRRPGAPGICDLACTTSEDCPSGLSVCAPTGFISTSGEPQRSCALLPEGDSVLVRRLSVEELALGVVPSSVIQVLTVPNAPHRLTASEAGICVSGVSDEPGRAAELVFQFGTNAGVPFDASGFGALTLESTGSPLFVRVQSSDRPGVIYDHSIDGTFLLSGPGPTRVPFERLEVEGTGEPWNPAQLEAIRLLPFVGPSAPYEVCVTALGFE